MKRINIGFFILMFCGTLSFCQTDSGKSELNISKSLDLYIFANNNQDKETQELDEFTCYKWAMSESEVDPMNLKNIEKQNASQEASGDAIRGAASGAALGAAMGAVTGDAGDGAAIGAIGGAASGMKRRRMRKKAKAQNAKEQDQQYKAKQMDSFKRAFQACMTSKGYTIN